MIDIDWERTTEKKNLLQLRESIIWSSWNKVSTSSVLEYRIHKKQGFYQKWKQHRKRLGWEVVDENIALSILRELFKNKNTRVDTFSYRKLSQCLKHSVDT